MEAMEVGVLIKRVKRVPLAEVPTNEEWVGEGRQKGEGESPTPGQGRWGDGGAAWVEGGSVGAPPAVALHHKEEPCWSGLLLQITPLLPLQDTPWRALATLHGRKSASTGSSSLWPHSRTRPRRCTLPPQENRYSSQKWCVNLTGCRSLGVLVCEAWVVHV